MLKRLIINNKSVPVPVPIKNCLDLFEWLEQHLIPAGHSITKFMVNKNSFLDAISDVGQLRKAVLTTDTKVEIQIDSPKDLVIQTLDAYRNLGSVVQSSLKQIAVECWQTKQVEKPEFIDHLLEDLQILNDLYDNVSPLLDTTRNDVLSLGTKVEHCKGLYKALLVAKSQSDWKGVARLLLNRLEPLLRDVTSEAEAMQLGVFTKGEALLANVGSTV